MHTLQHVHLNYRSSKKSPTPATASDSYFGWLNFKTNRRGVSTP